MNTSKQLELVDDMSVGADFPVTQFFMLYDNGDLLMDSKKFGSMQEIIDFYKNTPNFYRWVFVARYNGGEWNLEKYMKSKVYITPKKETPRLEDE